MSTRKLFLASSFLYLLILFSCKKSNDDVNVGNVIVSGISPNTGPYSTIVTITGSGFNSISTANTVKFNGNPAVVQSASSTQLVVIVPKTAGTGPVTVQNITGPVFNFIYTITASTFAGTGAAGYADGTTALFDKPKSATFDTNGNMYVADEGNHRIRKITPSGEVSTVAGDGNAGFADGNGTSAQFNLPKGIAVDANGNIYVGDAGNHRIRKITPAGVVSTLAGNGSAGFADGNGTAAKFNLPFGVAVDANGNVFVGDASNHRIRKITPAGVVSTLAGNGSAGFLDGDGASAQFNTPAGITMDANGNVYVADYNNHRIRKVSAAGEVSTFAGSGIAGFADGNGVSAQFSKPGGVTVDANGNIYVGDLNNQRIRKIASSGDVSTLAGSGDAGFADGSGSAAKFDYPYGVAIDAAGNVFVADYYNNRIRKIIVE